MRCPKCEQWNRANLPRCVRCGAELKADGVTPSWRAQLIDDKASKEYVRVDEDGDVSVAPDDREVLAAEMAELKARKEAGEKHQRRLRAEAEVRRGTSAHVNVEAEPEDPEAIFELAEEGVTRPEAEASPSPAAEKAPEEETPARRSRNPRGTRVVLNPQNWQDSRAYDPIVDDMQQRNVFQQPPNLQAMAPLPSRRMSHRRVIRMITLLLVVGVVGLVGFLVGGIVKDAREAEAERNRARVTASIVDDQAAHTILIPGEDGQEIFISNEEVFTSYPVVGGFASITIPDYVWYEDLPEISSETMTVTLIPSTKTTGGRQIPMTPIEYEITIPLSPIELKTPTALRTEVTTAMYSMTLKVRPDSKVIIRRADTAGAGLEVDVSDTVNESGDLTYNATVQPVGDNIFEIIVRSPYCRENSMTVVLYREYQEIPLDLAATTYTTTNKQTLEISCTTIPGADVDVLSPHSDLKITEVDTTGEFTFIAVFEEIGYNTISITASYPGKKTSRVDYVIYYVPSPDDYTPKAWPLNATAEYNELVNNIDVRAERSQIYVAVGTIDHFINEDGTQMAVMYCSDDGTSMPVLLENQSKTTWKTGQYYRIYCDAYGIYNGMPWLIARYTY